MTLNGCEIRQNGTSHLRILTQVNNENRRSITMTNMPGDVGRAWLYASTSQESWRTYIHNLVNGQRLAQCSFLMPT